MAIDVLARLVEVIAASASMGSSTREFWARSAWWTRGIVVSDSDRLVADYAGADPVEPGLTRADTRSPIPAPICARQAGGAGLVSTLPDMVALIRSLLPGGQTLLEPDTIEMMMTNQLPEGVWIRFPAYGEIRGRGHGLAGGFAFDHPDAKASCSGADVQGPNGGFRLKMETRGLDHGAA